MEELTRAALYARVSSDDQAMRGSIDNQTTALRNAAPHWGITIVDEYLDDGYSGSLPLDKRPEGLRLSEDAKVGKFDIVLFYKIDRLARSLRNFLDIVDFFEGLGIGLRSMSESFDNSNPMGKFAVHMIAAVAEMERGVIQERTTMGRNRVAAEGRWIGVIPCGYLLDTNGHLIPNTTPRPGYQVIETELIQRIFRMVADERVSASTVAKQFTAEGIPVWQKTQRKGQIEPNYRETTGAIWWPADILRIIRSTTYKGVHTYGQGIERSVPALVDDDIWERAQLQLPMNRRLSKKTGDNEYLLRGLIRCAHCGCSYVGFITSSKRTVRSLYYRCNSASNPKHVHDHGRCIGKSINAEWLEDKVWEDIKGFVLNPGDVIQQLKEQINSELESAPDVETRRRELAQAITAKEAETDRVLDAYRRGLMDIEALETHVIRSKFELAPLQAELANIMDTEAQRGQDVGNLVRTESLLRELKDRVEGPLDSQTKRLVVEALVSGVMVETTGRGRKKTAEVEVTYAFSEPMVAVENGTSPSG